MSKAASVSLVAVVACAAFAAGIAVGKGKKREIEPRHSLVQPQTQTEESDRVNTLLASLRDLGRDLADKEQRIRELENELEETRGDLPPPPSPEEEKARAEQEERRRLAERSRTLYQRSQELRRKILQRKDKALREEGLQELADLLKSEDDLDKGAGLTTLRGLWGFEFDKDRFKPDVLAVLGEEDAELRTSAFDCLPVLCSNEEQRSIALSMLEDSSPDLQIKAICRCGYLCGEERDESVASALTALLRDGDNSVRKKALDELWRHHFRYDYGGEIEDLVIELSKDPEVAREAQAWMCRRSPMSAQIAERLVELQLEGQAGYESLHWLTRRPSEEAKPVILDLCVRVLRDAIEPFQRQYVLRTLGEIGDSSVLPQLEAILYSEDAEGIERQLADTIERLQKRAREGR
jgi:hypothetical protein